MPEQPWTRGEHERFEQAMRQEHETFERVVGDRLDRIEHGLRRRYLILIACLLVVGCFGLWVQFQEAEQAHQIQQQRYDFFLGQCLANNHRFDVTVNQLDNELTMEKAKHPERSAEIQAQRAGTVALIQGLAPRTGKVGDHGAACRAKAHKAVPSIG